MKRSVPLSHRARRPATGTVPPRRVAATAAGAAAITLPRPKLAGRGSLAHALRRRRTDRVISGRKLPLQTLSELLWAACGVNRRRGPFGHPGLTAASASDSQEILVHVALEDGVYCFDPRRHRLLPVAAGDLRPLAIGRGQREMATKAPVQIIYVVDVRRLTHTEGFQEPGLQDPEVRKAYYYVDTGLIAAHVYLFAASRGLACWFHNCDRTALAGRLRLRRDQHVLFAQTVGYPTRRA